MLVKPLLDDPHWPQGESKPCPSEYYCAGHKGNHPLPGLDDHGRAGLSTISRYCHPSSVLSSPTPANAHPPGAWPG